MKKFLLALGCILLTGCSLEYDFSDKFEEIAEEIEDNSTEEIISEEIIENPFIEETEDDYIIDIDLPGFDKKDIQIDVENGYLNINAKSENSNDDEEKGKFIRRERYYGECSRSFYIGEDVHEDDIKATFKNGILSLDVPKVKEEEKKTEKKFIEIGE